MYKRVLIVAALALTLGSTSGLTSVSANGNNGNNRNNGNSGNSGNQANSGNQGNSGNTGSGIVVTPLPVQNSNDNVCLPLDSGKKDTTGNPLTVTLTAPAGYVITGYCVKAGSVNQDEGPKYVTLLPTEYKNSITITHPSGKAISHYSFSYIPTPGQGGGTPVLPVDNAPIVTTPAGQGAAAIAPTPTATIAALPYTAGDNTQRITLVASLIAAVLMIAGAVAKKAYLKQI